ncbi:MAG: hypothetical protein P4L40_18335, partial [Terracidiphilus sp.]|nr:hypothetical protein [Terracidiphilus sp.]
MSARHEGKSVIPFTEKALDAAQLYAEAGRDLLACVAMVCDDAAAAGDEGAMTAAWQVVHRALPLLVDVESAGLARVASFHSLPVPQGDILTALLSKWATLALDGDGGLGDSVVLSGPGVHVYAKADAGTEGIGGNMVRVALADRHSLLPLLGLSVEGALGDDIPVTLTMAVDNVQARYVVPPSHTGPVRLQATVCGERVGQSVSVPPGQGVGGRGVHSIVPEVDTSNGVRDTGSCLGLTVTLDGAPLVCLHHHPESWTTTLTVWSLPSGEFIRTAGVALVLPGKMCATPSNTLFIAERNYSSAWLQEVELS